MINILKNKQTRSVKTITQHVTKHRFGDLTMRKGSRQGEGRVYRKMCYER